MFIELHSLLTHDFFTIKCHGTEKDIDCRELTDAARIVIWGLIDSGLYLENNTWLISF